MAQLIVRNLEDDVRDKLREMAEDNGQSMEETVRDILRRAVLCRPREEEGLGTKMVKRFKGINLQPGEIRELRDGHYPQPADFSQHFLDE